MSSDEILLGILIYLIGAYIVSYIGKVSDGINRKNNPNYILSKHSRLAYYIAIVLSWAIVFVFIFMVLRTAFEKDEEVISDISDNVESKTDDKSNKLTSVDNDDSDLN